MDFQTIYHLIAMKSLQ